MTPEILDITRPADADPVLRLFPEPPRLLTLGEPAHGEDSLLAVRNTLFRQLVERAGYRTIALESDCLRGLIVDDYVTSGAGTLDDVMARGFSHGFGASPANRDLVRWMRAHNQNRPAAERVRFAGFDGPLETMSAASPRQALTALHDYLAGRIDAGLLPCSAEILDGLLGDDERWTDPEAMRNPGRSVGRTPEALRLRLITDDLVALLASQRPGLTGNASPAETSDPAENAELTGSAELARLHGRTAAGLLRYHHWMADTSPSRLAGVLGTRAAMMAANLLALTGRGLVLAHANNAHLQRRRSSMRLGGDPVPWWSAGAIVAARPGVTYGFLAGAVGTLHHRGVPEPEPGTIESLLYGLPDDTCVVPARSLPAADLTTRVSPWFGYTPLDPAELSGIDAVVFVKDAAEGPQWWPPVSRP
ncbi:erythromycin esterase family protein [Actinoplanes sp. DH11]|uniref:erythromycin esterase family protein n=1 Tax=Actinoplanes sp. DH11 TaxID=2857011 RepID=UPI001E3363D7|nr:erythromycin esterase family protein [Actinoplanes sp. DH11]